jgi:hypothetical protein
MKIENFEYNPQFLKSVLLLVLAVSGNFVGMNFTHRKLAQVAEK